MRRDIFTPLMACKIFLITTGPSKESERHIRWEQEPCTFTCWCSLLWEGRSSLHSHRACSHSLRSPNIPPYTCRSVALPPQACMGSHHCWGHRRSLSWKEGQLIQLDGRNTLQQRAHTRADEWLDCTDWAWQSQNPFHHTAYLWGSSVNQLV